MVVVGGGMGGGRSVVSKVAAILRTFRFGGSLTLTEIAQLACLPLSTTHRLVGEMVAWQLLHRGEDGRYVLIRTSASRYGCGSPRIREMAAPTVEDLSSATGSDVRLGLLHGSRVLYAQKVYGLRPLSDTSSAATLPAHATAMGQVLLAFSAPEVLRQALAQGLDRYTSSTRTTAARLDHAIRMVRRHRIAVVRGELRPDHSAVAAPVFGPDGILAALEVRLLDGSSELRTVVPALTIAARGLSRELTQSQPVEADEQLRPAGDSCDPRSTGRTQVAQPDLRLSTVSAGWTHDDVIRIDT